MSDPLALLNGPLSGFADNPDYVGPVLVLGFKDGHGLCLNDDGYLRWISQTELRIDIRYDWNSHKWVDVNGVTDVEEEPPADGGSEVP